MMHIIYPRAGEQADRSSLLPTTGEIVALALLIAFYLLAENLMGESAYPMANVVGPLAMSAILGRGAWLLVRSDGKNLWMALFWFRLSTIAYFGIGSYMVFVISPTGRLYMETFHWFFEPDIFKLNLIVAFSAILTLASARVAILLVATLGERGQSRMALEVRPRERSQLAVALVFLAVGMTIYYLVKVPYDFGWTTFEVPGSVMNLARLTWVGIFLITLWSLQHATRLLPIITVFVAFESLFQLLLFSKAGALFPLLMFLLAFLWAGITIKRMAICGALIVGVFGALQPLIGHGRVELERRYGDNPQASLNERAEILHSYFIDMSVQAGDEGASVLTRISYVNVATFLIQRYDAGHPADWPNLIPAVFVPRFLWPDKPVITDIGRDIYELATGRRTSNTAGGIFVDTYWAMGWWGVAVFMPIYGLILGVLTVMSARLLRQGRWLFFPVILMALQMGFRTDGHYIADVAGAMVILAGTFTIFWVLDLVLRSFARHMPADMRVLSRASLLRQQQPAAPKPLDS